MEFGYQAEYAKSDRSSCRLCKNLISKGSLRLAVLIQSPHFDGKIPTWYHTKCFHKKAKPKSTDLIKGFESLRWEDQQKLKENLGFAEKSSAKTSSTNNEAEGDCDELTVDDFAFEYAKSARSTCKKCDKKVDKSALRISKRTPRDNWYHFDCFVEDREKLGFNFDVTEVSGFDDLENEDKELLKAKLKVLGKGESKVEDNSGTKRKHEDDVEDPINKKIKEEKDDLQNRLKKQSELFWSYKDKITKEMSNDDIKHLLEYNNQKVIHGGIDDTSTQLADILCFGALENCSQCKHGQLRYSSKYYYCTGNITEWTKCSHRTQEPMRRECKIDEEFIKEYDFLKKYKYEERQRVFEKSIEEFDAYKMKKEIKGEPIEMKKDPKRPFENKKFAVAGKLKYTNAQIKEIISDLGGKLASSVDNSSIVAIISNKDELEKNSSRIQKAKLYKIHIVSDEFIDDCKDSKISSQLIDDDTFVSTINKHMLESWSIDFGTRLKTLELEKEKKTEIEKFEKSGGTVKMKLKGGLAVDPDSGLEDAAHVLREHDGTKDPFSVVLSMVDIMRGTNSYYKLQILESDKSTLWYIFRSWGRVGTSIGGNKIDSYKSKSYALEDFYALYLDKTGNEWTNRNSFTKIAGKFFPIEVEYGEEDDENKSQLNRVVKMSESKLEKPVQDVIRLIFDVEKMKLAMMEFEIDLNKMPLGKLSSNQLKKAFGVLNELLDIIDKNNKSLIIDASNRFYTLVPHNFGMRAPTLLDNVEIIKSKTDMLNNLLDIEIAYSMSKSDETIEEDPVDQHYKKLKCEIKSLVKESDEYARLLKYVQNTHAATHADYELIVEDIFVVIREGEREKYEPFSTLHNRKLLWHGSRVTNFAGILSQGLRIAPPEAPCTGYMFGKGVYFADMVSKSANYCFASHSNPAGLLLLCEVALGNMYEREAAEFVTKLPANKHSTKGVGRTAPNEGESVFTEDGLEIPMGKGVDTGRAKTSLLYNEYIVYDVSQVNIRYLLKTKFNFKY